MVFTAWHGVVDRFRLVQSLAGVVNRCFSPA
jgi:hypothetical protein